MASMMELVQTELTKNTNGRDESNRTVDEGKIEGRK